MVFCSRTMLTPAYLTLPVEEAAVLAALLVVEARVALVETGALVTAWEVVWEVALTTVARVEVAWGVLAAASAPGTH